MDSEFQKTAYLNIGSGSAGVEDSRGHKWFSVWSGGNPVGPYEYTGEEWVNHSNTFNNLARESLASLNWDTQSDSRIIITSMYPDTSGNLWVAVMGGTLLKYDGSNWSVVSPITIWEQVLGESINNWVEGSFDNVFGDNQGNMYAIASATYDNLTQEETSRVLKRSASGVWSTAVSDLGPIDLAERSVLVGTYNDATGDFWFRHNCCGYTYGAYRYHNEQWTNYTTAQGLASNTITDLIADSKGNVWATTASGASKFDGVSWSTWSTANCNLATNNIRQIAEDNSGRIWFITNKDNEFAEAITSIHDPAADTWTYYSNKNGDEFFGGLTAVYFFEDEAWATGHSAGDFFIVLDLNNTQATLYGQTSGDVVAKAGFKPTKKKKAKTIKNKTVAIYKITKVKKKKKYKTKKTLVYKTGATQWYKAINLDIGKYQVISKAKGKKKRARTINITNGNPYRLDLRY